MTIPVGIVWLSAEAILLRIVPEPEVAVLAGRYLKILLIGLPGYACFEAGRRFVQAQGLFAASLYVLLICAPLNAFMNWLFVWVRLILPTRFLIHTVSLFLTLINLFHLPSNSIGVSLAHRSLSQSLNTSSLSPSSSMSALSPDAPAGLASQLVHFTTGVQ